MKFSSLTLAFLVSMTAFACQKAATPNSDSSAVGGPVSQMGGADGGGGDLPLSSEKQVRDAIDYARKFQFKHAAYNLALMEDQIKDPYVKQILAKFFNDDVGQSKDWITSQPLIMDFKSSQIVIEEKSGCRDAEGVDHAAGVAKRELGSAVCFSLPKLRLVDPDSLQKQILSLMFHEFSHHFGFGELEAEKLQAFIVPRVELIGRLPKEFGLSFTKRLEFPAPARKRNYQYSVEYIIAGGAVMEATFENVDVVRNSKQPFCSMSVRWEEGTANAAFAAFDHMSLEVYNASSYSDFNERIGYSSVSLSVNPHFDGTVRTSSGAKVYYNKKDGNDGRIYGIDCQAESLHVMDLKLIFAAYGGTPNLR